MSSVIAYETNKHKWMMENSSIHNRNYDISLTVDNPTSVAPGNFTEWGPKRDPLYIVIPVTVIYTVIFLTGVIGNISTCIVIAKNKSMHTATNYYLFSLAVSDLLLLVCGLPPEIYMIWSKFPYVFGEVFCVLQGFAAETSANATVLTITAFTIERYVAICHPFLSHTMSKLSRAVKFVMAIWLVAMCLAIPQAMSFGIVYASTPDGHQSDEHNACVVKKMIIPHAFEISTFVFFVAPMSLITVLYVLIGLQLRRTALRGGNNNGGPHRSSVRLRHRQQRSTPPLAQTVVIVTPGEEAEIEDRVEINRDEDGRKNFPRNSQQNATRHVVKMLVAVVVAFFVCWAPFHAQRLLAIYGDQDHSAAMIVAFRILTYVSGVLYYLSTTVNPLLYHIMSHKFREAFKATFAQFLQCCIPRDREKCYSTLSGRSSQVNSHSGNTDSQCSRQSSLRYLDSELTTRRPLVVSFRRPPTSRDRINHNEYITRINHSNGRFRYGNSYLSLEPDLQKSQHDLKSMKDKKISMLDTDYDDLYRLNDPFTNGHCSFPQDDLLEPEVFICPKSPFQKKCQDDLFHVKFQQKSDFSRFLDDQNHYDGCRTEINKNEPKEYDSDCDFHLFSSESTDFTSLEIQNLLPAHICPLTFKNSQCHEHKHENHKKKKHRHHHRQNKNHLTIPKSHTTSNFNALNGNESLKPIESVLSIGEKSSSFSCLRRGLDGAVNGLKTEENFNQSIDRRFILGSNENCSEQPENIKPIGGNYDGEKDFIKHNENYCKTQNFDKCSTQNCENCSIQNEHCGKQNGGHCSIQNSDNCTNQIGGNCSTQNGGDFSKQNGDKCCKQNGGYCSRQDECSNKQTDDNCSRQHNSKQNGGNCSRQNGRNGSKPNGGNCSKQNDGYYCLQNGGNCSQQNDDNFCRQIGDYFVRKNSDNVGRKNGGNFDIQNDDNFVLQTIGICKNRQNDGNGDTCSKENDDNCGIQNSDNRCNQNGGNHDTFSRENGSDCGIQNCDTLCKQNGGNCKICSKEKGGDCSIQNGGNCDIQNGDNRCRQNGGNIGVQNGDNTTRQNGGNCSKQDDGNCSNQNGGNCTNQNICKQNGDNFSIQNGGGSNVRNFGVQIGGNYRFTNTGNCSTQNDGTISRQNGGDSIVPRIGLTEAYNTYNTQNVNYNPLSFCDRKRGSEPNTGSYTQQNTHKRQTERFNTQSAQNVQRRTSCSGICTIQKINEYKELPKKNQDIQPLLGVTNFPIHNPKETTKTPKNIM